MFRVLFYLNAVIQKHSPEGWIIFNGTKKRKSLIDKNKKKGAYVYWYIIADEKEHFLTVRIKYVEGTTSSTRRLSYYYIYVLYVHSTLQFVLFVYDKYSKYLSQLVYKIRPAGISTLKNQ